MSSWWTKNGDCAIGFCTSFEWILWKFFATNTFKCCSFNQQYWEHDGRGCWRRFRLETLQRRIIFGWRRSCHLCYPSNCSCGMGPFDNSTILSLLIIERWWYFYIIFSETSWIHLRLDQVRLSPTVEVYAQLSKPDGIREGSMPYTAWKCSQSFGMNFLPLKWSRHQSFVEWIYYLFHIRKKNIVSVKIQNWFDEWPGSHFWSDVSIPYLILVCNLIQSTHSVGAWLEKNSAYISSL